MNKFALCVFFIGFTLSVSAQIQNTVTAVLDTEKKSLNIDQVILYQNNSKDTLEVIYLNDWANSFRSKSTPLAARFADDYQRNFHYAKEEERGFTSIDSISSENGKDLLWERPEGHPDIVKLFLKYPLIPGDSLALRLRYTVKIPSDRFTGYGDANGNFKLRYWYLSPAVFDEKWEVYSNKNLGDLFVPTTELKISIDLPTNYQAFSPLNFHSIELREERKIIAFQGNDRTNTELYLLQLGGSTFESIETPAVEIVTNLKDDKLFPDMKSSIVHRITDFLRERLGDYPHQKLLVSREDYVSNPVYGLNQLPNFIRPFPDGFQYDIKQLKTITGKYLENTLLLNPRKEAWILEAIQVSLMMDYVDRYYPEMKLLGKLSDVIGIRWSHLADLEFNDQYAFLFLHMERLNMGQPLGMSQDSLIKFNTRIANDYKAGVGLKYLEDFLGNGDVKATLKEFYRTYQLKPVETKDFQRLLQENSKKDISWFFKDYVKTNKKIDFTIKKVKKTKDSLRVTIKNKEDNDLPVSLYGLNDGHVVSKKWVENIQGTKTVSIARDSVERLALNYEQIIPEINQRDNYHRVTSFLDKPVQFRLLLDAEDPRYHQTFLIPEFNYNLYDGITIGPKLYNKTLLTKDFNYSISPKIGFKNGAMVGSLSLSNTHRYQNQELHAVSYGISGTRNSYAKGLFYYKVSPYVSINFRNYDLRDNEHQSIVLRGISVVREGEEDLQDDPDYDVFNIRYGYNNKNMVDYFTTSMDYQLAKKFSKVSVTATFRKLFRNNRQINFRLYAGTFLFNHAKENDFFSFALDRPSDYLFDYNYYGRSESSGLFSQQFIRAEGGFKSKLQPAFANQWMTTFTASTNLWKWIYVYGDVGFVKNENRSPEFVYDSGVRVSLVQDYFEVFFPVYSNLGWEISQPDYDQKIRFIVSLDLQTLIKLFTRRWY